MADTTKELRAGEQWPFYGSLTDEDGGNLTITGTPTATLLDSAGLPVFNFDTVDVSGQIAGPAPTVKVWYTLDTTTLAYPATYTLVLNFTANGVDGQPRTAEATARIRVVASSAAPDTGDVVTLLGSAGLTVPDGMDVSGALAAATLTIQQMSGRTFSVAETDRRFSGQGSDYLEIDPCTGIASVSLLDPTGAIVFTYPDEEIQELPFNEDVKTGLKRSPWALYPPPHFPFGVGNIQVHAQWGEPLTDDLYQAIVEQAALSLAPALIRYATCGVQEWKEGDAMVRYNEQISQQILDGWRLHIKQVCGNRHRWSL